jgi:hypothetical protein
LSWNDLWMTNIQNNVWHPYSPSKMTVNTVNRFLIQWHLLEKVSMKFRNQIEHQVSDYRLSWASSCRMLTLRLITLTANCKDHEHTHGCALDRYRYSHYVSLSLQAALCPFCTDWKYKLVINKVYILSVSQN